MRIGHGYDVHRIEEGKPLVIGGVPIPCEFGLRAHSDGDVLLHALADAVLGAAGLRDIGYYFPDTSDDTLNMDSRIILARAVALAEERGLKFEYADCTIVAQKPKMASYIEEIRTSLATVIGTDRDRVNVKATTEEKLGFTGRGEGIAAHAVCILSE
ncbi:MAG: 2-C-methyl-D-erythritol 2,4-cyclodiphosphate synthase [Clostridia bacterium]|nr:2-C-methyl-D-erythritol 2,4-cyclodiphosphate synthase [Clostridia bacterium]